jgi:hypothetical protein
MKIKIAFWIGLISSCMLLLGTFYYESKRPVHQSVYEAILNLALREFYENNHRYPKMENLMFDLEMTSQGKSIVENIKRDTRILNKFLGTNFEFTYVHQGVQFPEIIFYSIKKFDSWNMIFISGFIFFISIVPILFNNKNKIFNCKSHSS